jgi:regulator of sigma E protease
LDLLPDPFRTILAFVVVLGVLVFFHELGHYLAARWRGVHVETFSIGFGRPLWSWTDRRGTNWRVAWIPLGGYVKLHGQEHAGIEIPPEQQARYRPGETFHDKPVGDRAIVVAAGPIANFALAVVLFAILFGTVGVPSGSTVIGTVVEGSAAARAGLQPGDRIIALDAEPVTRFDEVQRYVQPRAGVPIEIRIRRGDAAADRGEVLTLRAVPEPRDGPAGVGVLGITGGAVVYERLDPFRAVWAGVGHTASVTWQTLAGVWQMIAGHRGTEELGGPLRIAQLSGQVAEMGWVSLVSFIAVLSINLALINLFPIPILDGGHLVFYAIEAVRGRPLPPRAQEIGLRAGFALLITLLLFVTWNDLVQWGLFRWIAGSGG